MRPGGGDVVDPLPRGFDLVASHEQGAFAGQGLEQKSLISDPATGCRSRQRIETEVEPERFQLHAVLREARRLVHEKERDVLLRLQPYRQSVRDEVAARKDG